MLGVDVRGVRRSRGVGERCESGICQHYRQLSLVMLFWMESDEVMSKEAMRIALYMPFPAPPSVAATSSNPDKKTWSVAE